MSATFTALQVGKSLTAAVSAALTDYLNKNSLVPVIDPWERVMGGYVVKIHCSKWIGAITLTHEDLGLPRSFGSLSFVRDGQIILLDEEIYQGLNNAATQARTLLNRMAVTVHWGDFIPLDVFDEFQAEFTRIEQGFSALVRQLESEYQKYYDIAVAKVTTMAERAWKIRNRIGDIEPIDRADDGSAEYFIKFKVTQFMQAFPALDQIGDRYRLYYNFSLIPLPSLIAEQQAQIELIERQKLIKLDQLQADAEQQKMQNEIERLQLLDQISVERAKRQQKIDILERHRLELEQQQRAVAAETLAQFQAGIAGELRQRLFESLQVALEGIMKGKYSPSAGRSLRTMVDNLSKLAASDDASLQEMIKSIRSMLGTQGSGEFTVAKTEQTVRDLATLVQTELLMLGQPPRFRKNRPMDIGVADTPELARTIRKRVGLETSLAETLLDAAPEAGELIRRRRPVDL